MWKRFVNFLSCPLCKEPLELSAFEETPMAISTEQIVVAKRQGVFDSEFDRYVETGLLLCHSCKKWFSISHGLPVLLPYATPAYEQFALNFSDRISTLDVSYTFPDREPIDGEHLTMDSFSKEWLDYEYDGVIWEMAYEDHEKRFLSEMGFPSANKKRQTFLEVGCGLGITTYLAHKNYTADSVGVDLSLAARKACEHFKGNPFLHFVQASAFYLPFKKAIFDMVYCRGVLHHTYCTAEAFKAIATYCRPGGSLYVWVYGTGSIKANLLRRLAYRAETLARPLLSRRLGFPSTTIFLGFMALGYMAFNAFRHLPNPQIRQYNFKRALHAARDRFTPLYAHRHNRREVLDWFQEIGFEQLQAIDWQTMPLADQDDYRRNIGIRGKRKRYGDA